MKVLLRMTIVVLALLAPGAGFAQSAESGATSEPVQRTFVRDEVRTIGGDVYRGLILEQVAGQYVTIQLPSGVERTIPADEVVYAGEIGGASPGAAGRAQESAPDHEPSSEANATGEGAPESFAPADGATDAAASTPSTFTASVPRQYRLQIRSSDGERLHLRRATLTGSGFGFTGYSSFSGYGGYGPISVTVYEDLCSTPCDITVAEGPLHYSAIEEGRRRYRSGREPIYVNGNAIMELDYVNRNAVKAVLYSAAAAAIIGGLALTLTAIQDGELNSGRLIAGNISSVTGSLLFIPAAVVRSHYRHRIVEE